MSGLPWWVSGKESTCNAEVHGDAGSISGSGTSPGGGHGNPLQYSCLENPMDRGACWATVHEIIKSQTRLKWLSRHRCTWSMSRDCCGEMFPRACSTEHHSHALLHEWKIVWYNKHRKHCIKHLHLEMFACITILRRMLLLQQKFCSFSSSSLLLLLSLNFVLNQYSSTSFSMKPPYLWNTWNYTFFKKYVCLNSFQTDYIVVRKHAL